MIRITFRVEKRNGGDGTLISSNVRIVADVNLNGRIMKPTKMRLNHIDDKFKYLFSVFFVA